MVEPYWMKSLPLSLSWLRAFLGVLSDIICLARRSLALSCFQGTVRSAGSQHTSVPACLSHMQGKKKRSIKSNLTNGVHSCWDCIFQHLKAWVLHPDEKQLHLHVLYRPNGMYGLLSKTNKSSKTLIQLSSKLDSLGPVWSHCLLKTVPHVGRKQIKQWPSEEHYLNPFTVNQIDMIPTF